MKPVYFLVTASLVAAGATVWFLRQADEAEFLRQELESLRTMPLQRAVTVDEGNALLASGEQAALLQSQISDLRAAVAQEEREAKAAEKSLEEIREKLPSLAEGESIVSLGRITDMGKEAARGIRGLFALLHGTNAAGNEEETQASVMKLLAWMPEITDFEKRPAEIASFQAALLRELFGLNESQVRQVNAIIKTQFEMLQSARLTAANADQPAWKERRAAALTPLLWQLKPFMPPDFHSPEMLGSIVNVGAGLETKTETHFSDEPGKSMHSISMSLPSWPRPPWLPPKAGTSK